MTNPGATSRVKIFLSLLGPFGVVLDELLFEYGGRLKQDRINSFVEDLMPHINIKELENLDSEEKENFHDLLNSALNKVSRNKSIEKRALYRQVILNHKNYLNVELDLTNIYLDLIESLTIKELSIIESYAKHHDYYLELNKIQKEHDKSIEKLQSLLEQHKLSKKEFEYQCEDLNKKNSEAIIGLSTLPKFQECSYYNISDGQFIFLKQRLISLGIFYQSNMTMSGTFSFYGLSQFGKDFNLFLKDTK